MKDFEDMTLDEREEILEQLTSAPRILSADGADAIEALVTLRDDVFAQAADTRTIVFADGFSLHVESSWPA